MTETEKEFEYRRGYFAGLNAAQTDDARVERSPTEDPGCICKGNWRLIVKEESERIGKTFTDRDGKLWTFFGVVWGDDDLYYGMSRPGDSTLLSCVSSIEMFGYTFTPDAASPWRAQPDTVSNGLSPVLFPAVGARVEITQHRSRPRERSAYIGELGTIVGIWVSKSDEVQDSSVSFPWRVQLDSNREELFATDELIPASVPVGACPEDYDALLRNSLTVIRALTAPAEPDNRGHKLPTMAMVEHARKFERATMTWLAERPDSAPKRLIPEGWQLVPKEPNEAMLDACRCTIGCPKPCPKCDGDSRGVYALMLRRAPTYLDDAPKGRCQYCGEAEIHKLDCHERRKGKSVFSGARLVGNGLFEGCPLCGDLHCRGRCGIPSGGLKHG